MIKIDTYQFLNTLYPDELPDGLYITVWNKSIKTKWFKNINETVNFINQFTNNVYFGVGLGRKKSEGRLSSDDIRCIPGLWMDIDVKSPAHKQTNLPPNIKMAVALLAAVPFQPSLIIDSGHGIHAYWLFREPWVFETKEEHAKAQNILSRLQSAIKQRASERNYKLDSTHDLSRVLRPVGSLNYKTDPPLPVKLLSQTENRYDPDDFDILPDVTETSTEKRAGRFKRLPDDGPAENVINNCAFIQYCRDQAKTLPEPYWIAMIGNIARCSDGPEVVHELSEPYPEYSRDETDKKISHALNGMHPQTCEYIRTELHFDRCPFGGCGVKSPCGWALDQKKRPSKQSIEKLTDIGNAERFARMFGDKLRYCFQFGSWLIWDGTRWKLDDTGQVMDYAIKAIRSFYNDAAEIDSPEIREAVLKHAKRSESAGKLKSMIELSQHMMAVTVDDLDADQWLFNTLNCTINLKTGEIQPHNIKQLITKIAPVKYNPKAECPQFIKFLHEVFPEPKGQNIIPFLQRLFGYILTGDTSEQKMGIGWGSGANGKSTLLDLFLDMMGDYGEMTPTETFMAKRNEGIPNDIARLRGSRLVLASEAQEGRRLNEPLVKQVTGQDKLTARFLRQEFFSFQPNFKLILLTNHKPVARGDDAALWRRIMLIPFEQKFEGAKKDKTLPVKLRTELSGILNWCIEGCLEWQKQGLNPPPEVIEATAEYRNENDIMENWLEENCITGIDVNERTSILYKNFQEYLLENGERTNISQNKFSQKLAEKGFNLFKGTGGVRKIRGMALLATEYPEEAIKPDGTRDQDTSVEPF